MYTHTRLVSNFNAAVQYSKTYQFKEINNKDHLVTYLNPTTFDIRGIVRFAKHFSLERILTGKNPQNLHYLLI